MTDQSVALTILQQLGGNKFRAMTGANTFTSYSNGLAFKLPGGGGFCKDGINYVKITLTPADLYDVEFVKTRGMNAKTISKSEGIYFDQLKPVFETATGLRTSL